MEVRYAICGLALLMVACQSKPVTNQNVEEKPLKIEWSSHKGLSREAPDNTVPAFKLAWEKGTDAAECDVRLSKDNKIMVIHDGNTKNLAGEEYIVSETTSDVLRKLDVSREKTEYKGVQIPFLEEVIETIPQGKGKLYIEIKCGNEIIPYIKPILENSPKSKQLAIISFNLELMIEVQKAMPDREVHVLIGKDDDWKAIMDKAHANGIYGADVHNGIVTPELVEYAHNLGMGVFAWTVDDPEVAKHLMSCNVDGIESNSVPRMKELLAIN